MSISELLNILAERALIACDAAYFTNTTQDRPAGGDSDPTHLYKDDPLAPLLDSSPILNSYLPPYSYASLTQGYVVDREFIKTATGFKAVAFKNSFTNDVILTFGGTDGVNATDWKANITSFGFTEWRSASAEILAYLNGLPRDNDGHLTVTVNFTGQSLGGALAQYAVYEWLLNDQNRQDDASHVALTTFNALGGVYAIQEREDGGFNPTVLANLSSAANFVVQGDIVSRLGGGFAAGPIYQMIYHPDQINPVTGLSYKDTLGPIDSHRIESGFYANLQSDGFAPAVLLQNPQDYVLQTDKLTQAAALLGNVLNGAYSDKAVLSSAVFSTLAVCDPVQLDGVIKAIETSLRDTGNMSTVEFALWEGFRVPLNLASRPIATAAVPISLLAAGFTEALHLGLTGVQTAISSVGQFLGLDQSQAPTPPVAAAPKEYEMKAWAYLSAASGSANTPLAQQFAAMPAVASDSDALAQQLLTADSLTWRTVLESQFRDRLAVNQLFETVKFADAFNQTMKLVPQLDRTTLATLDHERDTLIQQTAEGIANSYTDRTLYPNVSFTPSGPLTFPILQHIIDGLKTELADTTLSAAARVDAKEAMAIVERAAETPVIQTGTANPFDAPGFDPTTAPPMALTMQRNQGQTLTLSLPYVAGQGGEAMALHLQGNQAQEFEFLTSDGVLMPDANGTVIVTVPEGEQQYTFNLFATDDTNSSLTLSATPLDQAGQPAGPTHIDATIQLTAPQIQPNGFATLFYPIVNDQYGAFGSSGAGGSFGAQTGYAPNFGLPFVVGYGDINYNIIAPPQITFIDTAEGDDTVVGSNAPTNMFGGGGNDSLTGGDGGNIIIGDLRDDGIGVNIGPVAQNPGAVPDGRDYLSGGAGADLIGGGGGNDVLLGGAGNDLMSADVLVEGPLYVDAQGNPIIQHLDYYVGPFAAAGLPIWLGVLHPGHDFMDGGAGNDTLYGDGGNDTLYGGTDNDVLYGDTPLDRNNTLQYPQTAGNDFVDGGEDNDTLFGGGGDDTLLGGAGNDVLQGDSGNDLLEGGAGGDLYQANLDNGQDTIIDHAAPGDTNAISFGAGISEGSLTFSPNASAHTLVIGYGSHGDTITLKDFDPNGVFGTSVVQEVLFSDGGQVSLSSLLPPIDGFVDGTNTNNSFPGNTITTGPADDFLEGGPNGMTLDAGDGNDTVVGGSGIDTIRGGLGKNELIGGAGSDLIYGEGINDRVDGGAGNDTLIGAGGGTYTYLFGLGGGQDVVDGSRGGNYVVRLSGDFKPSDMTVGRVGEDLMFMLPGELDTLTLQGLASNPSLLVNLPDGTVWTQTTLPLPGGTVTGTNGNDILGAGATNDSIAAGRGNDFVDAGPGNDTVNGGDGSDTLLGGTGNNQLFGGAGNDLIAAGRANDTIDGGAGNDRLNGTGGGTYTYLFGVGGGHDVIDPSQGGTYVVQLASGITPSEVIVGRPGPSFPLDLTLTLSGGQDTLTLQGFYAHPSFHIQFTEGTIWDTNALNAAAGVQVSDGTTPLIGYKDFSNTFVGSSASDTFYVNNITDTILEAVDGGQVFSTVDYTLPAHVQNLTLLDFGGGFDGTPETPLNPPPTLAVGNDLDNGLIANTYNDVLIGGLGDDTLGAGINPDPTAAAPLHDTLNGGSGNDSYVYDATLGGVVTILDTTSNGETNTLYILNHPVEIGRQHELSLALQGSALALVFTPVDGPELPGPAHEILIPNFNPNDAFTPTAINQIVINFGLSDETDLTYQQLIALGISVQATNPNQLVTGTNADDRMTGLPGDTLSGGVGNDMYFFNRGGGAETIVDRAVPGAMNETTFGAGITPGDLSFVQGPNRLTIQVGTAGDQLTLTPFDPTGVNGSLVVGILNFAEGLQVNLSDLLTKGNPVANAAIQGTDGADQLLITGANDTVLAGAGDDTILGGPGQTQLVGGDGHDYLAAGSGNALVDGGPGDDTLYGGPGADTLVGGPGFDVFDPGPGTTTYLFNLGDGVDAINAPAGSSTHVVFGPGISVSDLDGFQVDSGIVRFDVGPNFDGISVLTASGQATPSVTATFADGTTVDLVQYAEASQVSTDQVQISTQANQTLFGGEGANILEGGPGATTLVGGTGNNTLIGGVGHTTFVSNPIGNTMIFPGSGGNTYVINPGGSVTKISMDPTQHVSLTGMQNVVQFTAGYDHVNPILGLGSLDIHYGTSGGKLVLEGFDPNNAQQNLGIDLFQFTDRTLTYDQLLTLGFDLSATGPGQVVNGTSVVDRIMGTQGNDTLNGGAGNDVLTGGPDDVLVGGAGDDTYVYRRGDGAETVQDTALPIEGNRIQFGEGIVQSDLTVTQDLTAHTLTIQVGAIGTDKLVFQNFDSTETNGSLVAKTLAFSDGTTVSLSDLFPTNHAPIVANPLSNQTVLENTPLSIMIPDNTFSDPDASDTLAYSASLADGTALPAWLSFNPTTRTFSGTPQNGDVGNLNVAVKATDTRGLSVTGVFALTVQNVNDAPTVANPLVNQTVQEDAPLSIQVPANTFVDPDAGDALTYSATVANGAALPSWLSFDVVTRTFTGTPDDAQVGSLDLKVTATDSGNLSASDTFTLTIQNVNEAPTVANLIADQQAAQGTAFNFVVAANTFADVDVGDTLTYSATLANGAALPPWLSFNPTTKTFSGTPGSGDAGLLTLKVTATDSGNLRTFDLFELRVNSLDQVLTGTAGNDVLTGGVGNDQLFGLGGTDTLTGNAGDDLLDGGTGADTMGGGTGNDTYIVDNVGDVVTELANEGTDTVQSSLLTYTLGANIENLTLTGTGPSAGIGNALNNQLTGNSGANLLDGKAGADTMVGGAGDDLYLVDQVGDVVTEATDEGFDTISSSVTYSLGANVENLILTGSVAVNGTGNDLDNTLTGNNAANVLMGLAGNDMYVIGVGDMVIEAANNGTDTVVSSLTHTLAANVENLTLVGFNAINGTGNGLDNVLNGLLNLAGNTLTGGAGNDTYVVGSGDTVVEAAGGGTDTVQTSVTHTLGANVENLMLIGTGAINGTGNGLNNTLTGNSANNVLNGGSGHDTLTGGLGNDVLIGGTGNDTFLFSRGEGQDVVRDSNGTSDLLQFDATIDSLDLVISRQANDLRLAVHGSSDQMTVQDWYLSTNNRIETIRDGNGDALLSTQVDQLIQAMASFSQQTGLTWDQAIDQQPQQVQSILAASWQ